MRTVASRPSRPETAPESGWPVRNDAAREFELDGRGWRIAQFVEEGNCRALLRGHLAHANVGFKAVGLPEGLVEGAERRGREAIAFDRRAAVCENGGRGEETFASIIILERLDEGGEPIMLFKYLICRMPTFLGSILSFFSLPIAGG